MAQQYILASYYFSIVLQRFFDGLAVPFEIFFVNVGRYTTPQAQRSDVFPGKESRNLFDDGFCNDFPCCTTPPLDAIQIDSTFGKGFNRGLTCKSNYK